MQQTIVPGVAMRPVWQPERMNSIRFSSKRRGNLVVDPLAVPETDVAQIAARVNRSGGPCTLPTIANTDARDVRFYPSSQKLLVEKTGHLVRDRPILDYCDGE